MITGGGGYPSSHSGHGMASGTAEAKVKGEKIRRKRNVAAVTTVISRDGALRRQRKASKC
jgi:acid phosphatase family membrane protein YuiD